MKQVFLQKGEATVRDVPAPLCAEKDILVRVHYSFISSGTESASLGSSGESLLKKVIKNPVRLAAKFGATVAQHGVQATMELIKGKQAGELSSIGYSCSGTVIAIGTGVKKFRVGDLVACAGAGSAHHADIVVASENLTVKISDHTYLRQASCTTIGAIALQGIRRADIRLGERVCVIGLGLIGQLTSQLARASGCTVYGTDVVSSRIERARKLGADFVYEATSDNLEQAIAFNTDHWGVDATIITAASQTGELLDQAMRITRRKGRVILVGDVKLDFDRQAFYAKEIDLLISCSYGPGRYDHSYEKQGNDYPYAYVRWTQNRNMQLIVNLIERQIITVDSLIDKEFSIFQATQAYEALKERTHLGIMLNYEPARREVKQAQSISPGSWNNVIAYQSPEPNDQLRIAVVGAGGFAKVMLLPLLKSFSGVTIDTIIDTDAANAINVARNYLCKNTGNNYQILLANKNIHAVILATPHKDHTRQALDLMTAGKAVFVEKPAAVTDDDIKSLTHFFATRPDVLYSVDFNRSWSPFAQKIKGSLHQRTTPLIIHYRMNAGFIPKNHWIQQSEQGGRLIGEGCHIFELFCFLTDSRPLHMHVQPIRTKRDDLLSTDNVSVQVGFDDGSTCSLLYTSLGSSALYKERMEVFFDGASIVMTDYLKVESFGLTNNFNQKHISIDKGHKALLRAFLAKAKKFDTHLPIPVQRILWATRLSFYADLLARKGGGTHTF